MPLDPPRGSLLRRPWARLLFRWQGWNLWNWLSWNLIWNLILPSYETYPTTTSSGTSSVAPGWGIFCYFLPCIVGHLSHVSSGWWLGFTLTDALHVRRFESFSISWRSSIVCLHITKLDIKNAPFWEYTDFWKWSKLFLRTFAPIAIGHLFCARYSLSTQVPGHFQACALSRKLNKTWSWWPWR